MRLLTAAVVSPLLLAAMFLAPLWVWFGVVLVASAIAASELFAMTHPEDRVAQAIGIGMTAATTAAVYFGARDARVLLTTLLAVPLVGLLVPLWRLGDIRSAALRIVAGVAAPMFVGGSLATLALLRRDLPEGGRWVVMALTFAWLADTGGYFFGRFIGGAKLYEAVSPKKTRAGFVGSLVGASVGAALATFGYLPALEPAHAFPLAIVAGALGQLGDLAESLLKRSTGIKDSGWVVPGHGGILDRIDALLVVAPIVYTYALWTARVG
ncbi:MAG: phosphatidate cytidylyltransferase [Polyangiaceae bacterium]|nr:phosphatidate cytidylyltransferase [Polyangiaceae bacterium]